jgi:Uncharacterized conserved protein
MNKFAKLSILIGLCLICISILVSAFDFRNIFSPLFNETSYDKKEYIVDSKSITKIIIDTEDDNIKIVPYTGEYIKITYNESENSKYSIKEKNEVITLDKKSKLCFLCLDFNFKSQEIIVEVPEYLEIVYDVENDNGKIEVSGVKLLDSVFKTSNGKINVKNLEVKNSLVLKTSNGKVDLKNVTATNVDIKTSNGTINLVNVNSHKIIAKTSNSKIEFDNLVGTIIDFKTSNGKIDGTIIGDYNDYQKKIKTSNDKIKINGVVNNKVDDKNDGSPKKLTLKTSNGKVNIDFK